MAAKKKSKKRASASKTRVAKRRASPPAKKAAAPKVRVNEIVHWEIQSQNPAQLHQFYAEALGWKINADNPMNYGLVSSRGQKGIDGGIGGIQGPGSRVLVYATVPSIPTTLERIESLGGHTLMPRTDIGPVIMALYQDPEGNTMGLLEG